MAAVLLLACATAPPAKKEEEAPPKPEPITLRVRLDGERLVGVSSDEHRGKLVPLLEARGLNVVKTAADLSRLRYTVKVEACWGRKMYATLHDREHVPVPDEPPLLVAVRENGTCDEFLTDLADVLAKGFDGAR